MRIIESIKICSEPARIAKIEHVKKIAPLISIIETEYSNVSGLMKWPKILDLFTRK